MPAWGGWPIGSEPCTGTAGLETETELATIRGCPFTGVPADLNILSPQTHQVAGPEIAVAHGENEARRYVGMSRGPHVGTGIGNIT